MLDDYQPNRELLKVGLRLKIAKTQIMHPGEAEQVLMGEEEIEIQKIIEYIYLD